MEARVRVPGRRWPQMTVSHALDAVASATQQAVAHSHCMQWLAFQQQS